MTFYSGSNNGKQFAYVNDDLDSALAVINKDVPIFTPLKFQAKDRIIVKIYFVDSNPDEVCDILSKLPDTVFDKAINVRKYLLDKDTQLILSENNGTEFTYFLDRTDLINSLIYAPTDIAIVVNQRPEKIRKLIKKYFAHNTIVNIKTNASDLDVIHYLSEMDEKAFNNLIEENITANLASEKVTSEPTLVDGFQISEKETKPTLSLADRFQSAYKNKFSHTAKEMATELVKYLENSNPKLGDTYIIHKDCKTENEAKSIAREVSKILDTDLISVSENLKDMFDVVCTF